MCGPIQSPRNKCDAHTKGCCNSAEPVGNCIVPQQVPAHITKELRELTRKDMEWMWDHAQEEALNTLKICHEYTSSPLLHPRERGHTVVQCVTVWSWWSSDAEWSTSHICISACGDSVCTNQKGTACHCVRL